MRLVENGEQLRIVAGNNANKNSSRSHTVFRIFVVIDDLNTQTNRRAIRSSQINLVDLAGSEDASKTNAEG